MTDIEIDNLLRTTLADLVAKQQTPASTYRLQFHKDFTFRDAARIVPYLHALGITHCYASPYLKATPGSTHGYDVVDHTQLNPELGTRADFDAWMKAMRDVGMSHILDTVPNHMGVGSDDNVLWNDLLKHGKNGLHGKFFDVAWPDSPRPELKDKVLLPTLGEPYGDVLEKGQLKVEKAKSGGYVVAYFDRHFPLSPESDAEIERVGLGKINGNAGDAKSFDALDALLARQHFRLAHWRTASDEINYRRFFDVSTLAALAMERPDVFDEAHALIFDLIAAGHIAGLRIDHSDGLYDPKEYFLRLQRRYLVAMALQKVSAADRDAMRPKLTERVSTLLKSDSVEQPLYVVTEKILAPGEPLPKTWAMAGTSGYDILNEINGLFVDPKGKAALDACYRDFVGPDVERDYHELAYRKKREVLTNSFAGELNLLAHQLDRLAQRDRHSQDFTLDVLRDALRELIASFSVYRSYVTASEGVSARDVEVVEAAIESAKPRDASIEPQVYDFIRDALLLRGTWGSRLRDEAVRFAGKFQQLTSPVTAKGLEDTAFYIYHRLTSLNEVGGEPARFGVSADSLHKTLADRQKNWPRAMSVLSTHDTKRAEDVRARIHVLSELPEEWARLVMRLRDINKPEGVHPNDEYLLYQTLIGAWPNGEVDEAFTKRIDAYMLKAMREAKVRTSWTAPNDKVEKAMASFIARILDASSNAEVRSTLRPFQERVAHAGMVNSLAQTLVRLAAPGVPDTYQGTELWDLSLVDPDNRRPVDYEARDRLLRSLPKAISVKDARELVEGWRDGRAKLLVTTTVLRLRREHPELFVAGDYVPLRASGALADRVFAFARKHASESIVVVIPRTVAGAADASGRVDWRDTRIELPAGDWTNLLTGAVNVNGDVASILGDFPVALLALRR